MLYINIFLILSILWLNVSLAQAQIELELKGSIQSKILNEDRSYQICLPASYYWASDRIYPVLYVLDGESNYQHTAASIGFLSLKGEIPELIVVAISSTVRIRDFTQTDWSSHWVGGGGAKNFKQFLSEELIPKIEKDYRTNGFRIISGHSAAGQFVLYTLSSEPSLFKAYFAISPSLDWDNNLPQRSLEESFDHTDSLRAFLYFAWSDDLGQALIDDQSLLGTLATKSPNKFRWVGKAFPDETHSSIPLLAQIDAIRQLYTGYRFNNDSLNQDFEYVEKHFKNVSDNVGYFISVPEEIVNNFGYEELNKGNIPEAIAFFRRNIQLNPNSANAYDSITDAFEKAGMWAEAILASEKAIELAKKFNHPNIAYFTEHANKVKNKSTLKSEK